MNITKFKKNKDYITNYSLVSNVFQSPKETMKSIKNNSCPKNKKSFIYIPYIKLTKNKTNNKTKSIKNRAEIDKIFKRNRVFLSKKISLNSNNSMSNNLSKNNVKIRKDINIKNDNEKMSFLLNNSTKNNSRKRNISMDNICSNNLSNNLSNNSLKRMNYLSSLFPSTKNKGNNNSSHSNKNNVFVKDNYLYKKYDYIIHNLRMKFHGNLLLAKKLEHFANLRKKLLLPKEKRAKAKDILNFNYDTSNNKNLNIINYNVKNIKYDNDGKIVDIKCNFSNELIKNSLSQRNISLKYINFNDN